jgi:hypothetical protein
VSRRRNRGSPTLWAGIITAILLPVMVFEWRIPPWVAIALSIGAFFWIQSWFTPKGPRLAPDAEPLDEARQDTADALLAEGRAALSRLQAACRGLKDPHMKAETKRLAGTAERILADVHADPGKAMAVRRLMTFYLPNAASVVEGWRALEGRSLPAPERIEQTRETMTQLNEAFDRFSHQLVAPRVQTLELDLKVLNDALKTDLDRLP